MSPEPKPGVCEIEPYVAGRAPTAEDRPAFKLSSNESALGTSPKAIAAYEAVRNDLSNYPDGGACILRNAIADLHGLDADRVVCGSGSEELLSLLARAYLQPGDEVLFTEHAFIVYRIAALSSSAVPVAVPEKNLRADVDAILAHVTARTRLIYLANPNNPTGSCLAAEEVERLHAGLPHGVLLVIDAAYAEYVQRADYEPGARLVSRFDNVVMTRTFSKIYGLAGLRVGWAYCPPSVADVLDRVRGPFNVTTAAQAAAAAALADRVHVQRSIAHNAEWKTWLVQKIRTAGLEVDEGEGNFLLVRFPSETPRDARSADAFLARRGFILRPVANYGLPHCLRLTIGTEEANRGVARALADFMRPT
ncbi:MAG TPA: histidinol-phosphate transaminase [Rhizomicrobium sp.]|jgi:histidinol-phosphate aminotransferase|nr:histidinol-phosphate transaminase [Rhizomicrobium sp.]